MQVCRKAVFSFWEGNLDYNKQFLVGATSETKLFLESTAEVGSVAEPSVTGRVGLDIWGDLLLVSNDGSCNSLFAVSNRAKKLLVSLVALLEWKQSILNVREFFYSHFSSLIQSVCHDNQNILSGCTIIKCFFTHIQV